MASGLDPKKDARVDDNSRTDPGGDSDNRSTLKDAVDAECADERLDSAYGSSSLTVDSLSELVGEECRVSSRADPGALSSSSSSSTATPAAAAITTGLSAQEEEEEEEHFLTSITEDGDT
ncbi:hypothetical protein CRUP_005577 [Coryphaenoides rupestris]|nr:hypothetical protein CRUP_005577 [Coryphaenoides rupestris]